MRATAADVDRPARLCNGRLHVATNRVVQLTTADVDNGGAAEERRYRDAQFPEHGFLVAG